MTADGFIAGPNGEMDWVTFNWDDGLKKYVTEITEPVDCIVLGRKLAQGFIPHWAGNLQEEGADKINSTKKVVFTKTLENTADWENTTLAKGDLTEEITRLKNQDGGDIIAYGGAEFVSSLIEERLIDELHLFINPAAIGNGLSIFKGRTNLQLAHVQGFNCGVTVLCYKPNQ